jgi:hypothetical protein
MERLYKEPTPKIPTACLSINIELFISDTQPEVVISKDKTSALLEGFLNAAVKLLISFGKFWARLQQVDTKKVMRSS